MRIDSTDFFEYAFDNRPYTSRFARCQPIARIHRFSNHLQFNYYVNLGINSKECNNSPELECGFHFERRTVTKSERLV